MPAAHSAIGLFGAGSPAKARIVFGILAAFALFTLASPWLLVQLRVGEKAGHAGSVRDLRPATRAGAPELIAIKASER